MENYLSGAEMLSHGFSVSWAMSQYQTSINAYGSLAVPANRLIEGEEYSMTNAGNGYGRDGVSMADWDTTMVLPVRVSLTFLRGRDPGSAR